MKFTNKVLEAFDEPGKVVFDELTQGLGFRSSAKGRGAWLFRFTSPVTGKRREKSLGSFPKVSLPRARDVARQLYLIVEAGGDPIQAAQDEKAAETSAADAMTFEKAAHAVHKELSPGWRNEKHSAQWINTLSAHAFPVIGAKPVGEISPADCADVLRPIWLTTPETASRVRQRMHAVMQWCWAHQHIAANPVAVVDHILPKQKAKVTHQPSMPWKDVPAFLATHVRDRETRDTLRAAVEFAILTAARSGEVREATWGEFDLDRALWVIPGERMKMEEPHRVPLSSRAVALLRELKAAGSHESIVFPSPRKLFFSDMAPTEFLRRVGAHSATPGRTATLHGYRSSFRDWASENGYARDLAERALAHAVENKVESAYHRTDLLEQRRPMMEAWSTYLLGQATERQAA